MAELLRDETRPLVHRAYQEMRSPGSIFKPFVGAAALEEGVATPSTRITSTGAITVRSVFDPSVTYTFRDWAAHGTLDFYGGLIRSSDVYYYYLSGGYAAGGQQLFEGLGVERIARYVRGFGLGAPTGLDLPGEAGGLVPDIAWKEEAVGEPWVLGDTYTLGIGQGYLTVTPLQMAVATAALANGGEVLVPRVVRGLGSGHELRLTAREVAGELPIAAEHLEVVREALRRTADPGGTATLGEPAGLTIAGKTGTAEFGPAHPDGGFDSHGWFLAFAPYEEPEIAVVVYLEHGGGRRARGAGRARDPRGLLRPAERVERDARGRGRGAPRGDGAVIGALARLRGARATLGTAGAAGAGRRLAVARGHGAGRAGAGDGVLGLARGGAAPGGHAGRAAARGAGAGSRSQRCWSPRGSTTGCCSARARSPTSARRRCCWPWWWPARASTARVAGCR